MFDPSGALSFQVTVDLMDGYKELTGNLIL
jgi:hypothetical protein